MNEKTQRKYLVQRKNNINEYYIRENFEECISNNEIKDKVGMTCKQGYEPYGGRYCGEFDTTQFKADELCCACGGGKRTGN